MCISIHTFCTRFLLINTSLASLLSIFMGILFCKAEEPGPLSLIIGLLARVWCFLHRDPASISGWEPKPCSKPVQAEATRDQGGPVNKGSGDLEGSPGSTRCDHPFLMVPHAFRKLEGHRSRPLLS